MTLDALEVNRFDLQLKGDDLRLSLFFFSKLFSQIKMNLFHSHEVPQKNQISYIYQQQTHTRLQHTLTQLERTYKKSTDIHKSIINTPTNTI